MVGFGVHGRNTEIIGFSPGRTRETTSAGAEETNTIDQLPLFGNSTSPTLRNWLPDWLNTVSKICFRPL